MAEIEETSEQLARRLVAKITDDQRRGPLGGSPNAKAVLGTMYTLAAAIEDLAKALKGIKEADDVARRLKLKTASEVTVADLVPPPDAPQ